MQLRLARFTTNQGLLCCHCGYLHPPYCCAAMHCSLPVLACCTWSPYHETSELFLNFLLAWNGAEQDNCCCRSTGSYSGPGEVVGRYASAPNLNALATVANPETHVMYAAASGTQDQRRLSADLASSKNKASSPLSHGQTRRTVSFTSKPQFGQSAAGSVNRLSDSPQPEPAIGSRNKTAPRHPTVWQSRQLHQLTKGISHNWVFLLVCTVNVAAMSWLLSHQASGFQMSYN